MCRPSPTCRPSARHSPPALSQRAHCAYRRLSRFVAENFEHMLVEETRHNAALWELYTDAELR